MNIRDLEYLVAVADLKHFRKAAERCCVSQPTLSGQIKKLEDELGVELIERTKHKVIMTPIGLNIAMQAELVLSEASQIQMLAQSAKDPTVGPFKIGVFPTLAPYLLPHITPSIQKKFPNLSLYLIEEQTKRILTMIKDGKLDMVILALPEEHDDLDQIELFEEPFYLALTKNHRFSRKKSLNQSDLKGEALMLLEDGHCLRENALEVCAFSGAKEALGFRASSLETLRQMVAVGTGITLIPKLAVNRDLSNHNLIKYLPFTMPVPARRIGLLWRKTSHRKECIKQIAEIIKKEAEKALAI